MAEQSFHESNNLAGAAFENLRDLADQLQKMRPVLVPREDAGAWFLSGWIVNYSKDWEGFTDPQPIKDLVVSLVDEAYIYQEVTDSEGKIVVTSEKLRELCVDLVTHKIHEEVSQGDASIQGLIQFIPEPQDDELRYQANNVVTFEEAYEQFNRDHMEWETLKHHEDTLNEVNGFYITKEQIIGMLRMSAFLFGSGVERYLKTSPTITEEIKEVNA